MKIGKWGIAWNILSRAKHHRCRELNYMWANQIVTYTASVCSSQSRMLYGWQHCHVTPYYTSTVLSMLKESRIAPAANGSVKIAVQWPWPNLMPKYSFLWSIFELLLANTAKVWLLWNTMQLTVECLMSQPLTPYLWLVYPHSVKFSEPFLLPWHCSCDKDCLSRFIAFLYCEQRIAEHGPMNKARVHSLFRTMPHALL